MKDIKKIVLGLLLFLLTFSISEACKFSPREYSEIYKNSESIFLGKIIPQKEKENGKYLFEVLKTLKGRKLKKNIKVSDPMVGTSCQKIDYRKEKFWIISMNSKNEISETNLDKSFKTEGEAKGFFAKNFVVEKEKIKSEKLEQKGGDIMQVQIAGPKGPPNVKGPTAAPPTRAEIDKMKAVKEGKSMDGLGFWEKVWNWIINLFK